MTPERPQPSVQETILETAISPFLTVDRHGAISWASRSIEELLGYEAATLIGTSFFDLMDPASHQAVFDVLARARDDFMRGTIASWQSSGLVVDFVTKDGTIMSCDVSGATSARTGLDDYVVQLRRGAGSHGLRRVVETMAAGDSVVDVLATIATVLNESFAESSFAILFEWDGTRFACEVGAPTTLTSAPLPEGAEPPWITAAYRGDPITIEHFSESTSSLKAVAESVGIGGLMVQPVSVELMDRPTAAIIGWWEGPSRSPLIEVMLEQTASLIALVLQWDQGRQVLEWNATHDSLTGLGNRRVFTQHVHDATASGSCGAVFYLDLDDFKAVNDTHGHLVGDTILAAAAERLRACARPGDLVARIGGDEFAVFCPGLDDPDAAEVLARRFVAAFEHPITVDGVSASIGVSIGVALTETDASSDSILARADVHLLQAKSAGKRQVRIRQSDDPPG